MSALPPKADIRQVVAKRLLVTQSGHLSAAPKLSSLIFNRDFNVANSLLTAGTANSPKSSYRMAAKENPL